MRSGEGIVVALAGKGVVGDQSSGNAVWGNPIESSNPSLSATPSRTKCHHVRLVRDLVVIPPIVLEDVPVEWHPRRN